MPMHKVDEAELTKGEVRKLAALRNSLGQEIADEAFAKWKARQERADPTRDPNVQTMEEALNPLVDRLHFRTGVHYTIRRGRGRVIVEAVMPQGKAKKGRRTKS